jgi:hypothetical protein
LTVTLALGRPPGLVDPFRIGTVLGGGRVVLGARQRGLAPVPLTLTPRGRQLLTGAAGRPATVRVAARATGRAVRLVQRALPLPR